MIKIFEISNLGEEFKDLVREILEEEGSILVEKIKGILTSENKVASGGTLNSIDYVVVDNGDGYELNINADEGLHWIDQGRAPGKQPPTSVIEEWMSYRGIPADPGVPFLIARHIGRFGIQGLHFLDEIQSEYETQISSRIDDTIGGLLSQE